MRFRVMFLCLAFAVGAACATDADHGRLHSGPSEELRGTYETTIPGPDFDEHDLPRSNGGKWTITFEGTDYILENQSGFRITEEYWTKGTDWYAEGVPAPEGAFVCNLLGRPDYDGSSPSVGIYSIEADKEKVSLTAEDDPCDFRVFLLEREWERTKKRTDEHDTHSE